MRVLNAVLVVESWYNYQSYNAGNLHASRLLQSKTFYAIRMRFT